MSTFCTFFRHDSVIADLTLNVDIADDLHGMSSYFAQVKVHESFPITFFFFFQSTEKTSNESDLLLWLSCYF